MRYRCPNCRTINMLDISNHGNQIPCGKCEHIITVPSEYLAPGVVFGDFVIIETLLSRSHEVDFIAEQISLKREVVLKVIKPELCIKPEFIKTFLDAGRLSSRLSHPFLCQVIALGKEYDIYYLTREIGGAHNLRDHLVESGVLNWRHAFMLVGEIAEALDFAWDNEHLLHLNLKPDSIAVDSHSHARLADIGLAGLNPDPGSDRIIGTPQYISPERIVGMDGDNRSDIYSLGVTLFLMLTGQFPFIAEGTNEFIDKHLNEVPRRANSIIPDIPEDVCRVIDMMLEKNPNMRYQSGHMLIEDLSAVLRGYEPPNVIKADDLTTPTVKPITPALTPEPDEEPNAPTVTVVEDTDDIAEVVPVVEAASVSKENDDSKTAAAAKEQVSTNFDAPINVDDVFSDFDDIFEDLDAEIKLKSASDGSAEDRIPSEEFNDIVTALNEEPVHKGIVNTPSVSVPQPEPPTSYPVVTPPEVVEPIPPRPIAQALPDDNTHLATEVDALFDEELPPVPTPPAYDKRQTATSFPSLGAQDDLQPQGLKKPKKKKFKTRTKTKVNLRRK